MVGETLISDDLIVRNESAVAGVRMFERIPKGFQTLRGDNIQKSSSLQSEIVGIEVQMLRQFGDDAPLDPPKSAIRSDYGL